MCACVYKMNDIEQILMLTDLVSDHQAFVISVASSYTNQITPNRILFNSM